MDDIGNYTYIYNCFCQWEEKQGLKNHPTFAQWMRFVNFALLLKQNLITGVENGNSGYR